METLQPQAKKLKVRAKERKAFYFAAFVVLFCFSFAADDFHWKGSQQLHTLMELVSTLVAFFVGLMALAMYGSDRSRLELFIVSMGFLGTAFLDGYHCFATTSFFASWFPSSLESLVPWSWHASRMFLSLFLCLALAVTWKKQINTTTAVRV
ncbi:MAG: MASE3 domain-containing protein [Bacteroidota bacterium]